MFTCSGGEKSKNYRHFYVSVVPVVSLFGGSGGSGGFVPWFRSSVPGFSTSPSFGGKESLC